jgi:choline dehydrogenase-like flavoprotein
MLTDSNSIPRGTRMSADVCIVGAGAAGITLALSLLERNIDVIVLESGYDRKDARTQGLYAGEVADASLHSPPDKYRLRQFGGSTLIWGGRCVPFDPVDFEIRASVPNSGWPISYSELLRYYPAANELSEAGRFEYDADQLFGPTGLPMIEGFSSPLVRTNSLERFSYPTNFAARYARRLRISRALRLLLGANCTEIELDSSADRVNCM